MKPRLVGSVFAALALSVTAAGCIPAALVAASTTPQPTEVTHVVTHVIQQTPTVVPTPRATGGTSVLEGGDSIIIQGENGSFIVVNPNSGVGRPVNQQEALSLALAAAGGGEPVNMATGYENGIPMWAVRVRRPDNTLVDVYVNATTGAIAHLQTATQ